jgi:hypothetical protein
MAVQKITGWYDKGGDPKYIFYDTDKNVYFGAYDPKVVYDRINATHEKQVSYLSKPHPASSHKAVAAARQLVDRLKPVLEGLPETDYVHVTDSMFDGSSYDFQRSVSYNKDAWSQFLGRTVQNERITEEQGVRQNVQTNRIESKTRAMNGLQDLAIQQERGIPATRTRGTGLGARADVFGGRVEAGLGV